MQTPITIPAIAPLEIELWAILPGTLVEVGAAVADWEVEALSAIVVRKSRLSVEEVAKGGLVRVAEVNARELVGVAEVDVDGALVNKAVATLGETRPTSPRTRSQNASVETFYLNLQFRIARKARKHQAVAPEKCTKRSLQSDSRSSPPRVLVQHSN